MGTSKARDQAGSSLELASSVGIYHRSIEADVNVILPHAVQDDSDTPSQRNYRTLGSTTARKFCGPGSQPCRSSAMHQDRGSLTQRASKFDVARLGDAARDVSLARLVAEGSRPTHGPNFFEVVHAASRQSNRFMGPDSKGLQRTIFRF